MSIVTVVVLGMSVMACGLFSGLMFSLIALLQPKWEQQTATEYITDIQPFLKVGKGNPAVSTVLFVGLFAPIPALIGVWDVEPNGVWWLMLVGWIVFSGGALGITVFFNLPTYTALMALDANSPAENWEALRRRFYYLNLSRFAASTTAFLLFIMTMVVQLAQK